MEAILIKNGIMEVVELEEIDTRDRLREMREYIECEQLETTFISPDYVAWVDEEGLFKENPKVRIVAYVRKNQITYANEIAGNILVTGYNEEGETLGLTNEQQEDIKENLRIL